MTETLFALGNLVILPFWLLMILLPGWPVTRRVIASPWIAAPPALLYAGLLAAQLGTFTAQPGLGVFTSAAGLASLLAAPGPAATVWLHMLALDLFAGRWAYLDARDGGLNPWLVSPLLFLILMAGPLGLLLYLLARAAVSRPLGAPQR
jgi:hypothetical protein